MECDCGVGVRAVAGGQEKDPGEAGLHVKTECRTGVDPSYSFVSKEVVLGGMTTVHDHGNGL